jgi:DNA-binding XRE family transcriptional regulator
MMLSVADRYRFWLCVPVYNDDACWPWMGPLNPRGYGRFSIKRRRFTASRIALELSLGRHLSDGEMACHKCDNPPCCNPRHLFVGSQADNMRDAARKGRMFKWRGYRSGEDNQRAKLTAKQVAEIRTLKGRLLQREIAAEYGVSRQTVSAILNGDRWQASGAVGNAETPKRQRPNTPEASDG